MKLICIKLITIYGSAEQNSLEAFALTIRAGYHALIFYLSQLTLPDIYSNPEEASRLAKEKEESEQKLEQVMSKWTELQEKLI